MKTRTCRVPRRGKVCSTITMSLRVHWMPTDGTKYPIETACYIPGAENCARNWPPCSATTEVGSTPRTVGTRVIRISCIGVLRQRFYFVAHSLLVLVLFFAHDYLPFATSMIFASISSEGSGVNPWLSNAPAYSGWNPNSPSLKSSLSQGFRINSSVIKPM